LVSSSRNSISGMVGIRPSICAVGETTVSKMIDDPLVGILFRPHKYETEDLEKITNEINQMNLLFQGMWTTAIIEDFTTR